MAARDAEPVRLSGGPAPRRGTLVRMSVIGIALLALANCGIVPISGPPEGDFGSRSSRQRGGK